MLQAHVMFAYATQMRPILTKWATSDLVTKGNMAYWTFLKSIENKGINQGNNGFLDPK